MFLTTKIQRQWRCIIGEWSGKGGATPYTIVFHRKEDVSGSAMLRLAICGTGTRVLDVLSTVSWSTKKTSYNLMV